MARRKPKAAQPQDEEAVEDASPQSPEQQSALKKLNDWYLTDKAARQFYVEEMDELDKLYQNDHWDLIGPAGTPLRTQAQQNTRPNTVENVTFAMVEGLVSEFAADVDIVDFPVEAGDEQAAQTMTDLKKFIAYKNNIEVERQTWNRHFFHYGTGIWHPYWDPEWKGGRGPNRWVGDVRWKALHPRNFIPDARCNEDVNHGKRVHKATYVPLEHIRERYPEFAGLVRGEAISDAAFGTNEDHESFESKEDTVLLVETWYTGPPLLLKEGEEDKGTGLHVMWWAGEGQQIYLDCANYVYFDEGENPVLPFLVRQRYPRELNGKRSIWGFGDTYYLKSMQISLNKTRELILEAHMHQSLGQTFYQTGAVSPEQEKKIKRYGTLPNMWFEVNTLQGVKREYGQGVPASLMEEPARLLKAMENITGRFDISQGKTPGSVTAFRALDLLAARAQVRLRSAEVLIKAGYQDLGNYTNHLVLRHYTEQRAFRIMGRDDEAPAPGVFNLGQMKKVYIPAINTTVAFEGFTPPAGAVEGKDYEIYAPEFDTRCRVSTAKATDRVFFMEMAKELFVAKVIDPETFLHVLEHGRFPPVEEILARLQQMQQQQMQQEMAMQAPPEGAEAPAEEVVAEEDTLPLPEEFLASLPEDVQLRVMALPEEQQAKAIADLMDKAAEAITQ